VTPGRRSPPMGRRCVRPKL